jgi:hypothetical protein
MKAIPLVFFGILLTALSWGMYGNVLHTGQHDLENSALKAFICVGMAYFVIAMIVPTTLLVMQGKLAGDWTGSGVLWSMMAGAVGAFGALGVTLALSHGGNPIYVMPLVFGGAPVVNTLVSTYTNRNWKSINPIFIAGLLLVVAGAATVLVNKPGGREVEGLSLEQVPFVLGGIAVAMVSWGLYGIFTHWGQHDLGGGRLKPLICVGFAYFLIAIVVPVAILASQGRLGGSWTFSGIVWSSGAGAAGALGALGTVLALSSGGKPIYVMPLIFGGAPVVNTLMAVLMKNAWGQLNQWFLAGLILVAVGAVVVLIFQPRGGKPGHKGETKKADEPMHAKEPVVSGEKD